MTTTYTYSLSVDFSGNLNTTQLYDEIEADGGIAPTCVTVSNPSDDVDIIFDSALSSPEQTTLDTIVSNHVPSNANNYSETYTGYISFNSTLADARSIRILATDTAGGIDIDAGTGGIAIDTTNAISLDAAAASNFTTTSGNLTLDATVGLVNIDGGSGINIGSQAEAQPINIGTGVAARTITIGNAIGSTNIAINTGTGGFTLDTTSGGISLDATGASCNFTLASTADAQDLTIALTGANNSSIVIDSAGTGADAIRLNSTGGIDIDTAGQYNVNTSSTAVDAFRFSCAGAGGFDMDLGTSGLDLDTTGDINLASSKASGSAITLDSSAAGGITISSGSFGILMTVAWGGACNIGNDTGTGDITLGTGARERDVEIGSTTTASSTTIRHGTGGFRKYQPTETSLTDANATLTITQLKTGILSGTPTVDRNLTMPTASLAVAGLPGIAVDDAIDFTIIDKSLASKEAHFDILMGTGGTMNGNNSVSPKANNAATYETSGSGTFRMRFTNVTAFSEAYTLYRIS